MSYSIIFDKLQFIISRKYSNNLKEFKKILSADLRLHRNNNDLSKNILCFAYLFYKVFFLKIKP